MNTPLTILQGDALDRLRGLPDNSVHCCITSPPYFGLRSYLAADDPLKASEIGAEKDPQEYIAKLVLHFREVRRVLREDGVFWLNLGDSYAANRTYQVPSTRGANKGEAQSVGGSGSTVPEGMKPKDLLGIPHRVAFALQADGWYLRAICPWPKHNGMPESCRDRPTQTVEYVFLFSKSPKYFYDSEATRLPGVIPAGTKGAKGSAARAGEAGVNARPPVYKVYDGTRLRRTSDSFFESFQGLYQDEEGNPLAFVVNTKPFKGTHFATFPPKLIEPMILAGTSAHGCCIECGAPWTRVLKHPDFSQQPKRPAESAQNDGTPDPRGFKTSAGQAWQEWRTANPSETVGWISGCVHCHGTVPCTVLDPFGGSGTTGEVALKLDRRAVLIELNPSYIPLIETRTALAA